MVTIDGWEAYGQCHPKSLERNYYFSNNGKQIIILLNVDYVH